MTFKLMTSQVVQRTRPLTTHICVVGIQRVKVCKRVGISQVEVYILGVEKSVIWQKISVTSPIVINMPTRDLLASETKNSFV